MAFQTAARWLKTFAQHFDQTVDEDLTLNFDPNGGLESTAAGIRLKLDNSVNAGALTLGANGVQLSIDREDTRGVISASQALPTAASAETTSNNGVAYTIGDTYMIVGSAAITVGGYALAANQLPAELIFNGSGDGTADPHWTLVASTPAGVRIQTDSFTGADRAGADLTLSKTPSNVDAVEMDIEGAPDQLYGTGYSVAGTTLTIDATLNGIIVNADVISVTYPYNP